MCDAVITECWQPSRWTRAGDERPPSAPIISVVTAPLIPNERREAQRKSAREHGETAPFANIRNKVDVRAVNLSDSSRGTACD